jgi:hypothetical protein
MSELAFNINGEAFDLPATATGWRVRRMKQRGAPEVVYSKDGVPLVVPIEAGIEELRQLVPTPGRYRLDAIDDRGRTVEDLPASYVIVPARDPQVAAQEARAAENSATALMAEAMRTTTELARTVIDRFPQVIEAAATLLRAADGAGLPARAPRAIEEQEDETDEEPAPAPAPPANDLYTMLGPVLQMLAAGLMNGSVKLPDIGALFDWRKAKPSAPKTIAATSAGAGEQPAANHNAAIAPAAAATTPSAPISMAHLAAIQAALAPNEVAYVMEVSKELSAAERGAWFDKLAKLNVPEAVELIRGLIAGKSQNGGAS